ncbi:MAG: hydantoinase/oxoprolinase family protein [Alphaproteobacteria bacterium]|nr:hydantoinase/oxoprolinase family protein [Alphaproteobacteria bacterium]
MPPSARLAVDIGGTFTDVVVETTDGRTTTKVLTTPRAPEVGVIEGIRRVLQVGAIAPADIAIVVHGTTLATNAIIERKGAPTALITTDGFRDSVEMALENRFEQYDLYMDKPPPLVPRDRRFTVIERVDARGRVLRPLDEAAVAALAERLPALGIASVAVGFLHSYANPEHERRAGAIVARHAPGLAVTLSSDVCPEIREYDRLSTACANAYVQPLMASYLARLADALKDEGIGCPLFLMQSGGGLLTVEMAIRQPIRLVESGPAGGAILAGTVAEECGLDRVLSYDMGGTTAKICLIDDGRPETARSFEVGRVYRFLKGSGLPLRIPVIEMVEIGAGGGSIARIDALGRIAVGPDSAGSEPGPVCYARGGTEPTVTDADVVMGRVDPARFAGGKVRLDPAAAETAVAASIGAALDLDVAHAAHGIAEIVDENMANAARVHAIERGKAVADRTLVAFGGAAPLHAGRLAEKLGIARIVVPSGAGVGSAIGFLRAPVSYEVVRSHYARLSALDLGAINAMLDEMAAEARSVVRLGAPAAELTERRQISMRYVGQGHEIVVALPARRLVASDAALLQAAFDDAYRHLYARTIAGHEAEILSWTLNLSTTVAPPARVAMPRPNGAAVPAGERSVFDPSRRRHVAMPVHRRDAIAEGALVRGPALIVEDETTTVVPAAFDATVNAIGYIVMTRRGGSEATP